MSQLSHLMVYYIYQLIRIGKICDNLDFIDIIIMITTRLKGLLCIASKKFAKRHDS